jgi:hypothetical protein
MNNIERFIEYLTDKERQDIGDWVDNGFLKAEDLETINNFPEIPPYLVLHHILDFYIKNSGQGYYVRWFKVYDRIRTKYEASLRV